MELITPNNWPVSVELLLGLLAALVLGGWAARSAYGKIMDALADLRADYDALKKRNAEADRQSEAIKTRQGEQDKAIAVMAEQLKNINATTERIERGVERLTEGKR